MLKLSALVSVSASAISAISLFLIYRLGFEFAGRDAMGIWALVSGLLAFARFGDSGIGSALMRQSAIQLNKSGAIDLKLFIFAGITIATLPVIFMSVLISLGSFIYIRHKYSLPHLPVLTLEGVIAANLLYSVLNSTFCVIAGCLDGVNMMLSRNLATIFCTAVFVVTGYIFIPRFGLPGLAACHVIFGASQCLVMMTIALIASKKEEEFWSLYRRAIRESWAFLTKSFLIGIARSGFEPLSKLLIGAFCGLAAVAIFDFANRISLQVRQLVTMLLQPLAPLAARESARLHEPVATRMWQWSLFGIIISGILAAGQIIGSPFLSMLVLKRIDALFLILNAIMAIGGWLNAFGAVGFFSEIGGALLRRLIFTHIMMLVINALGGLVLVEILGASGVAFAWSIALSYGGLILFLRFCSSHPFAYGVKRQLLAGVISSLVLIIVAIFSLIVFYYSKLPPSLVASGLFAATVGAATLILWVLALPLVFPNIVANLSKFSGLREGKI